MLSTPSLLSHSFITVAPELQSHPRWACIPVVIKRRLVPASDKHTQRDLISALAIQLYLYTAPHPPPTAHLLAAAAPRDFGLLSKEAAPALAIVLGLTLPCVLGGGWEI